MDYEGCLEFIKGLIRPFVIVWGISFYTACHFTPYECPMVVSGLIGAITIEYFGERARKRFKGE